MRGIFQGLALINMGYMAYYAKCAGVSVSVIVSMISVTTFFIAIVFYFLYGEKLTVKHILGMVSIICCVAFITISKVWKNR